MTEQELRALVREAVARHLGGPTPASADPSAALTPRHAPDPGQPHASHGLYVHLVNVTDACLIEPAVTCTHCGYCKSHGH
jgi:hypothetical protein